MANGTIIKLRNNTGTGNVPVTTDLILGELAVNSFDGHIFLKKNDGLESIVNLSTDYVNYNTLNLNGSVGTGATQVSKGDHTHSGVYEPADSTILREADVVNTLISTVTNAPLSAAMGKSLQDNKIESTDVTYEVLNTNGDVGTGVGQLAIGNHTHTDKLSILDAPVFTTDSVTSRSANTELVLAGNGTAGVTVQDKLTINGDLSVTGTTTTINTDELNIADNEIVLNSDYVGATPEVLDTGIRVNRGGTVLDTSLFWSEALDKWRLTEDGTNYYNILTDNDASVTAVDTLVLRDVSGNFTANIITADLVGNADTASTLETARTISVTGAVTGTSASWDGSNNLSIATTLTSHSHTSGDLPATLVYDDDFASEGVMYRGATTGTYSTITIDSSVANNSNLISNAGVFSALASKQNSLTFGIADTNSVVINSLTVNVGEYARFTASGLESRTGAELISDLNLVETTDSIDVFADIDTSTSIPITGEVLTWDGINWVPDSTAATYSGWTVSDGTLSENIASTVSVEFSSSTPNLIAVGYNLTTNIMDFSINTGTTATTLAVGNHTHTLGDLTDVSETLVGDANDDGLILSYNGTTDMWTSTHVLDGGTF